MADELKSEYEELVHLARLALSGGPEDVRLYVARLVRRFRATQPALAEQLNVFLQKGSPRNARFMRRAPQDDPGVSLPVDGETHLSLLRQQSVDERVVVPIFSEEQERSLRQLAEERKVAAKLLKAGLTPTRSAIFLGRPGVGKTLAARWLAQLLGLNLYVLDLSSVMSSFLGKTGVNIRAALEFAKANECILLIDEIDAIAKRRSDDADVGELKRLVTVILQEIDEWPSSSLLLAATNHPELIDPAIWRRFDMIIEFQMPDHDQIARAIERFMGKDVEKFRGWLGVLSILLAGESFGDIEKAIYRVRRFIAIGAATAEVALKDLIGRRARALTKQQRIDLAVSISALPNISQHFAADVTGVSRDTIRKYTRIVQ